MPIPSLVQQKGPNTGQPGVGSKAWLKQQLTKWDKGSRNSRYDMLQAFAAKFNPGGGDAESGGGGGGAVSVGWGGRRRGRTTDAERSTLGGDGSGILGLNRGRFTPAHVLEREYGGAASLFLMRVTAWLRTSYLMNHPIAPMLDCIAPFLTSATTGGAHFLEQFIDLGGVVIALDILTIPRVSPADKLRALRVLEMVAEAGAVYKRRICESPGGPIDVIVGYLADSAVEDDGGHGHGLGGGGDDVPGMESPEIPVRSPGMRFEEGIGSPHGGASSSPAPRGSAEGTGKEPPMLHAQRLLVMLGTGNQPHSQHLEAKVCQLMRVPNVYVQRAAAKLTREFLVANHSSPPPHARQHRRDRRASSSCGSSPGSRVEDEERGDGEGEGEGEGEGKGGGGEPRGESRVVDREDAAAVAAAASTPPHLRSAAEAALPLTHSHNFRVQMEAVLLLDQLAKFPGGKDVIAGCREALGYPPEE